MRTVFDEFEQAFLEVEQATPSQVTWNGNTYPACPSQATKGKALDLGGWNSSNTVAFICRTAVFPSPPPQLKQQVTYRGTSYRIENIETLTGGYLLRFTCIDPTAGI